MDADAHTVGPRKVETIREIGRIAVSYTHLDVYKRQDPGRSGRKHDAEPAGSEPRAA